MKEKIIEEVLKEYDLTLKFALDTNNIEIQRRMNIVSLIKKALQNQEEKTFEIIEKFFNTGCGKEFMEFPEDKPDATIDDGWDVMCGRTMADGHYPLCEDCIEGRDELKRIIKEE